MNIREGAERGGKMFDTNTAAEAAGRATAQLDQVEHVIHEPDGTICGRTSYGKGRAHQRADRDRPRPSGPSAQAEAGGGVSLVATISACRARNAHSELGKCVVDLWLDQLLERHVSLTVHDRIGDIEHDVDEVLLGAWRFDELSMVDLQALVAEQLVEETDRGQAAAVSDLEPQDLHPLRRGRRMCAAGRCRPPVAERPRDQSRTGTEEAAATSTSTRFGPAARSLEHDRLLMIELSGD